MRTKHVLLLSSAVLLGQGLVLLFAPTETSILLGMQSFNSLMSQLFGLILIAFASVNLLVRTNSESRLIPLVIGNFFYYTFGFGIIFINFVGGASSLFIFMSLGIFFLMTLFFGYLLGCFVIWNHLLNQLSQ